MTRCALLLFIVFLLGIFFFVTCGYLPWLLWFPVFSIGVCDLEIADRASWDVYESYSTGGFPVRVCYTSLNQNERLFVRRKQPILVDPPDNTCIICRNHLNPGLAIGPQYMWAL